MKKLVIEFIKMYGTKVRKNESASYVELMMDDHICIEFDSKEYYIAENNSAYNEDDEIILEYLKNCCHV
jgi:hypothetical protein